MEYRSPDRRPDKYLVAGQVDLDLGQPRRIARTAVRDPTKCGGVPTTILPSHETAGIDDDLQTDPVPKPITDPLEDRHQILRMLRPTLDDREIEILRETVCLVEALPQARASLEYPGIRKLGGRCNRSQHPSEHVVLFDDVGPEIPFASEREYLGVRDHEAPLSSTSTLALRPHRPTRGPRVGALESSREMPPDNRSLHAVTSSSSPRWRLSDK